MWITTGAGEAKNCAFAGVTSAAPASSVSRDAPAGSGTRLRRISPAGTGHWARERRYPNILQVAMAARHDEGSGVGRGCDNQFEFEFALDLLLDGFERLHGQGWNSTQAKLGRP